MDVIISNCVINLSPDKPQVFKEGLSGIKKGGRFAISDVVLTAELPPDVRNDLDISYSCCISGAVSIIDLENMLKAAGFVTIVIQPKDESKEFIRERVPGMNIQNYIVSSTIQAIKP